MDERTTRLTEQILALKKILGAVILAHNYELGEIQDIADYTGDSLELSRIAADTDAQVIVFCGVHFMAETAAILNPGKTVLLPDAHAGCPMADMATGAQVREMKKQHPDAKVVCYVNTSAEVKAESDVCCTSANSIQVVQSIDAPEIIFVPDKNLGRYTAEKTGRNIILWPGFCPTHDRISTEDVQKKREEHPGALVIVHPECRLEVIQMADHALSTGGMCRFVRESDAGEFIIGTEMGIIHRLRHENPDKQFYAISEEAICPYMKMITLETLAQSLADMAPVIRVPEETANRARASVERMLALNS